MPLTWSFQPYATAIKMGHVNSLITSLRGTRSVSLLKVGVFTGLFMFVLAGVNSEFEDQMGIPSAGVLCVSDCSTCPVICSPPPPSHPAPSLNSPPPQTHHHYPPPPPSPPPPQSPTPPPQQLPRESPPPTPSWYPSWGMPPPPPSGYYYGTPASKTPPAQGQGQHAYPYPYYYFYASGVPSLSVHASMFLSFLFSHLVYLCC